MDTVRVVAERARKHHRADVVVHAAFLRVAAAVLAALVALALAVQTAAVAAPRTLPGYTLLVDRPGLHVFGPGSRPDVLRPRLLFLPAGALLTVKRAVELAMPPFERKLKLDGRNAVVKVAPSGGSGFGYRAGGCGRTAWARSIVATVLLPHVEKFSASMSQHTFAAGRVRQGWVLWGYIH